MTTDLLAGVPARPGHFLLESGYHTDVWLTLDALFADPGDVAPRVAALGERLRRHDVSAVCGPLMGGAFLAQGLATALGAAFYYAEPGPVLEGPGLFKATYRLPAELGRGARGRRVAVVDDVISAASSVRATIDALTAAGASVAVVGTFLVLGHKGIEHFAAEGIPLETLAQRDLALWAAGECPLCQQGTPLEDPLGLR